MPHKLHLPQGASELSKWGGGQTQQGPRCTGRTLVSAPSVETEGLTEESDLIQLKLQEDHQVAAHDVLLILVMLQLMLL